MLLNRSFTISHPMTQKKLFSEGLLEYTVKAYKAMVPYNNFLARAMEG